jgi:hypothetical protein
MKQFTLGSFILLSFVFSCGDGGDGGGETCGEVALQGAPVPESSGVGSFPSPAGGSIAEAVQGRGFPSRLRRCLPA